MNHRVLSDNKFPFSIYELLKTTRLEYHRLPIELSEYPIHEKLCKVTILEVDIAKIETTRKSQQILRSFKGTLMQI